MERSHVQAYLEVVLKNIPHPTDRQIKEAKAAYWKQYRKQYQRKRRQRFQEFTLGFDKADMARIHQKREEMDVSAFLYACVDGALEGKPMVDTTLLGTISQQQMEIIALLEELLDSGLNIPEPLLERMEVLETSIAKLNT